MDIQSQNQNTEKEESVPVQAEQLAQGTNLQDKPKDLFCEIKLESGAKYVAILPAALNLKEKDFCVIRRERVLDYGQMIKIFDPLHLPKIKQAIDDNFPRVERKATMQDQGKDRKSVV